MAQQATSGPAPAGPRTPGAAGGKSAPGSSRREGAVRLVRRRSDVEALPSTPKQPASHLQWRHEPDWPSRDSGFVAFDRHRKQHQPRKINVKLPATRLRNKQQPKRSTKTDAKPNEEGEGNASTPSASSSASATASAFNVDPLGHLRTSARASRAVTVLEARHLFNVAPLRPTPQQEALLDPETWALSTEDAHAARQERIAANMADFGLPVSISDIQRRCRAGAEERESDSKDRATNAGGKSGGKKGTRGQAVHAAMAGVPDAMLEAALRKSHPLPQRMHLPPPGTGAAAAHTAVKGPATPTRAATGENADVSTASAAGALAAVDAAAASAASATSAARAAASSSTATVPTKAPNSKDEKAAESAAGAVSNSFRALSIEGDDDVSMTPPHTPDERKETGDVLVLVHVHVD